MPRHLRSRAFLMALVLAAGCTPERTDTALPAPVVRGDVHSYARPEEARVRHVSLDLTADFAAHRLIGTARLAFERTANADSIVLDVRDLEVQSVSDVAGRALPFHLSAADSILGQALTIRLPERGDTIVIAYATTPVAAAVQWLSPEQTAGKQLPFLFTQGQAILTRTWVPTQDSPGIRQTYDAAIHVPAGMRAVMSARHLDEGVRESDGSMSYRFALDLPVPPYLFALAVGDIVRRDVGPRSAVWAEPSVVDSAAREFAETEQMIAAAEKLYGPYRWGRYDLLVLPPSFPFGGMENPLLTFATPTVLAGDRSLVSLVAHELAHSWSGNLVTNADWNDFWINEGFTTYLERRIMEQLRGKQYADMLLQLGRKSLESTIADLGGPQSPDTKLRLDLAGRNPDDGMTDVAYEKGSALLQTIEATVGRERLDTFLRGYFDRNAFQPMTSELLLQQLNQDLFKGDEAAAGRVRAQQWIYEPGVPDNVPAIRSELFEKVDQQVAAFTGGAAPAELQTKTWSSHEWLHFLQALPKQITRARLDALDQSFGLSRSGNSEILFEWLRLAIRNRYEPAFPALERFLTTQGRRRFVAPLYQDLAATAWGRPMAQRIYARARPGYHSVTAGTIDGILR